MATNQIVREVIMGNGIRLTVGAFLKGPQLPKDGDKYEAVGFVALPMAQDHTIASPLDPEMVFDSRFAKVYEEYVLGADRWCSGDSVNSCRLAPYWGDDSTAESIRDIPKTIYSLTQRNTRACYITTLEDSKTKAVTAAYELAQKFGNAIEELVERRVRALQEGDC